MKFINCGLVLLAIFTARANATPDSNVNSDGDDDIVVLWTNVFKKMNLIETKINRLSDNEEALNERLKVIGDSLREQSLRQNAISQSLNALSARLSSIGDSQRNQSERLRNLYISQIELTENLLSLNEKEASEELTLSQWMENTEKKFSKLEKSLAEQEEILSLAKDKYFDNVESTTIMRREDGSVDFYRNWTEYKKGFGSVLGEFFIGLDELHRLTSNGAPQELLVVLKDKENEKGIARYDRFRIGNEKEKYALLELGKYSGDAGDALSLHMGLPFSTYDQDNDSGENVNCARFAHGAWWFKDCYISHLFGRYIPGKIYGVVWNTKNGEGCAMRFAEMKIRPKRIKT